MQRGDIWLVDLEPVIGSEAVKVRPAVIVSNNASLDSLARRGRGVVTVVPLTSNVTRIYPFQTLLPSADTGLDLDSKAQAEQVRSIASERLVRHIGRTSPERLRLVDSALRLHLAL